MRGHYFPTPTDLGDTKHNYIFLLLFMYTLLAVSKFKFDLAGLENKYCTVYPGS